MLNSTPNLGEMKQLNPKQNWLSQFWLKVLRGIHPSGKVEHQSTFSQLLVEKILRASLRIYVPALGRGARRLGRSSSRSHPTPSFVGASPWQRIYRPAVPPAGQSSWLLPRGQAGILHAADGAHPDGNAGRAAAPAPGLCEQAGATSASGANHHKERDAAQRVAPVHIAPPPRRR